MWNGRGIFLGLIRFYPVDEINWQFVDSSVFLLFAVGDWFGILFEILISGFIR